MNDLYEQIVGAIFRTQRTFIPGEFSSAPRCAAAVIAIPELQRKIKIAEYVDAEPIFEYDKDTGHLAAAALASHDDLLARIKAAGET